MTDHVAFLVPGAAKAQGSKASQLLGVLGATAGLEVVIPGDPVSKARPRFTANGKPYTPRKTIEGERAIAWTLKAARTTFPSNVAVACMFYRSTRQRIDVDNLLKAVLDGGTQARIWVDDSQVTAIVGIVEYDRDNPRTEIAVGTHTSSLTRGEAAMVVCEACGKSYFPSGHKRRESSRWCSRECRTVLQEKVPCAYCGAGFKRRTGNQKYCCGKCRGQGRSEDFKEARRARTHCLRGHELTPENTYVVSDGRRRCRTCQADAARRYRRQAGEESQ